MENYWHEGHALTQLRVTPQKLIKGIFYQKFWNCVTSISARWDIRDFSKIDQNRKFENEKEKSKNCRDCNRKTNGKTKGTASASESEASVPVGRRTSQGSSICFAAKYTESDWGTNAGDQTSPPSGCSGIRSCFGRDWLVERELEWSAIIGDVDGSVQVVVGRDDDGLFATNEQMEVATNGAVTSICT